MARFNLDIDYRTAVWSRMVQSSGLAFLFVPISTVAFAFIPKERTSYATGLFNLARNIGGSAGIATVTTLLARRAQFHQQTLVAHLTPYDSGVPRLPGGRDRDCCTPHGATLPDAAAQAAGLLYGSMLQAGDMLAFADAFWLMGVLFLLIIPLMFLMKKLRPARGPVGEWSDMPAMLENGNNRKGKDHMPNALEDLAAAGTRPRDGARAAEGLAGQVRLLVVLLAIAAAALWAYLHYRDRVSSDDAEVDGHITAIAPKIAGNVVEVLVNDNQPVKAGQVLVRIDPRDYQARVDMAKAALMQAESQLRSARVVVPLDQSRPPNPANPAPPRSSPTPRPNWSARAWSTNRPPASDLAYAEANVRTSQASNDRAQADLARMKPLVDKAEISQLQYDAYVAAARVAESELQAAQEKLASAQQDAAIRKAAVDAAQSRVSQAQAQVATSVANRKQVDIRTADAGTAAAAVEAARANLEAAELQLSYTTIVAPIDGVVTRKSVEIGQIVQPGQGLMTIIPLQRHLGHRQFQGDPARRRAPRPAGRNPRGHVRPQRDRPRGFHRRRHRLAHEPAAARERHRQFRQGGAAHSR